MKWHRLTCTSTEDLVDILIFFLFVLSPGQQFFSHFRTESPLPGYLPVLEVSCSYLPVLKVSCSRHYTKIVGFVPWTSRSEVQSSTTEPPQGPGIHVISLERESGRFSFHFREVFQKCIEYIGRLLIHFREIS